MKYVTPISILILAATFLFAAVVLIIALRDLAAIQNVLPVPTSIPGMWIG